MKNLLALFILIVQSFSLFSQVEKEPEFKPKEGNFGVVFNIAGLISNINVAPVKDPIGNDVILAKYYLKDNHVIRVGLGVQSFNSTYQLVDSVGSSKVAYDSTFKKFNLYLSPAYEYHFAGLKRLDPYIGAGLNFGILGKTKNQIDIESADTTGTDKSQITYNKDGGFMFGINGIVGFNYFIAPRLAMGLEYNIGYYWSRDGGDWERVTVETPVSGSSKSKREIGSERLASGGFDFANNLSITVSYYFGGGSKTKQ